MKMKVQEYIFLNRWADTKTWC